MPSPPSRRAALAAAALLSASAMSACSSGADSRQNESSKPSGSAQTPAARLAAVKGVMDAAGGMRLTLSSANVPASANGVLKGAGQGTSSPPAFKGNLTAKLGSIQADVPVIAIGDRVWAKLPIWPTMRTINPKEYGAPNPAYLFSTDRGIGTLLPKTKSPAFGAERREGSEVVRPITGTLAGTDVVGVLTIGDPSVQYRVEYLVTGQNQLRVAKITGAFYNDATSTYTVRLDQYGQKVAVQPPA